MGYVVKIMRYYSNFIAVINNVGRMQRESRLIRWKPLATGWVKLNFDGACMEDGRGGYGSVIRDSNREWIRWYAKRLDVCSAFVVKFWRVYEGMQLAKRMGVGVIQVNVDSRGVVNGINNTDNGNITGKELISKIQVCIRMDWKVIVNHVYCESNQIAEVLAKSIIDIKDMCIYETCPSSIRRSLDFDFLGTAIPHLFLV
ncbi:unnamed protein product [Lathyrus oleraceus]